MDNELFKRLVFAVESISVNLKEMRKDQKESIEKSQKDSKEGAEKVNEIYGKLSGILGGKNG